MGAHQHGECPWRVQVCAGDGAVCGGGVLLGGLYVLTCAHVVEQAAGPTSGGDRPRVRVESVGCEPQWISAATAMPGLWRWRAETRRGDVALLELRSPPGCGAGARLRQIADRGKVVRAFGFPHEKRPGLWSAAEVIGSGGYDGWIELRINPGDHPISEGYSGSGVALDGGAGEVVGIVVSGHTDTEHRGTRVAWMLPVARIIDYIPGIGQFVLPEDGDGAAVLRALADEVDRLLAGDWCGTAVITGGGSRAVRSWSAFDLVIDAAGRDVAEVWRLIAERFGLAPGGPDAVSVLRHKPAVTMLVDKIDRANDYDALLDGLLVPLAKGAWLRGARLVLGFEGHPPSRLPHEVSLGAEPIGGTAQNPAGLEEAGLEEAERAVGRLAEAEGRLMARRDSVSRTFIHGYEIPPGQTPRLRIRLTACAGGGDAREVAAIRERAERAEATVSRLDADLQALPELRQRLRDELVVLGSRADRWHAAEKLEREEIYARAHEALYTAPCDLALARRLVTRYRDVLGPEPGQGSGPTS